MDLQLDGKVALVTGAGRNIGEEIALTLAGEKANVAVNDFFPERAEAVVQKIISQGGHAISVPADVRKAEEVGEMVAKASKEFGRVDILVNNAGILPDVARPSGAPVFQDLSKEDWNNYVEICLNGVFNCIKAVIGGMIDQKYGKIVNIVSDAGRVGEPRQAAYAAAKAGIIGLSKSLAKEVGRYCINVNCVSPGATPQAGTPSRVDTEFEKILRLYPIGRGLGRLAVPSDIANATAFFASDVSVFITGQVLSVSGGYSMLG